MKDVASLPYLAAVESIVKYTKGMQEKGTNLVLFVSNQSKKEWRLGYKVIIMQEANGMFYPGGYWAIELQVSKIYNDRSNFAQCNV